MNELIAYGFLVTLWCIYLVFNIKTLNATSVFSILFVTMYGYAFINYQLANQNIEDEGPRTLAILLILFIIFFNIGNKFLFLKRRGKYNFVDWNRMPIQNVYYQKATIGFTAFLVMIVISLGLFVFHGIDGLRYLSSSDYITPEQIDELRQKAGVQGPISAIYPYFITAFGRFFAFMFFADAIRRKKRFQLILSVMLLALILLALLANLSKSSAFIFILQILVFFAAYKNVKVNMGRLLIFFGVFLGLLIGIYIIVTGVDNSSAALALIGNRLFAEPIRVLNLYTNNYPSRYPHTNGMNTRLIYMLFGEGDFVGADVKLSNYKGTVNSLFIADAWVDYAYVGVVIESFLMGIYMAYLDKFLFSRKTIVSVVVLATIILSLLSLPSLPMLPSMITFGLLSVPLLSIFITRKFSY